MNDQKFQLEFYIQSCGGLVNTNIYELNRDVNRNILSAVDYERPIEMLKRKLEEKTT